jgi:putative intracellular protease/amidase
MRIVTYLLVALLMVKGFAQTKNVKKILIVTSNQHTYGDTSINASNHFSEIVLAYDVFVKNGYSVDIVSPKGGAIPIGYIATSDSIQKKYLYKSSFMNKLKTTYNPSQVRAQNYKAIYYSGGGSAMFGVAENVMIKDIAEQIYRANGIVSAICHGTAGIVNLKDENGNSLYRNRKLTGFPDLLERTDEEYYKTFPFSIEKTIRENKGLFIHSQTFGDNFFIRDGRFITGQDPSATKSVAMEVVKVLESN